MNDLGSLDRRDGYLLHVIILDRDQINKPQLLLIRDLARNEVSFGVGGGLRPDAGETATFAEF